MRSSLRLVLGAAAALLVPAAALLAYLARPLPGGLADRPVTGIRIEDRNGLLLRSTRAGEGSRQSWAPLAEIDPDVIAAFLAVEDRRFYRHRGVDGRALARAARDNLGGGTGLSGGSTITMQLARIYFGTPRTLPGKVVQVLQARRLEWHLDKQTILEQYLNRVPLGQGAVGVPAAAALYFNRGSADLSLGESALLAALARGPSSNNPIVSPSRAEGRRQAGLRRLVAAGYATEAQAALASQEPILARGRPHAFLAPHFTSRILQEDPPGAGESVRRTTLDLPLQRAVEAEVRHTVDLLGSSGARHAAVIVLENQTGEILAWVGSPDFWSDTSGQVDMVVSARQPGSALKPFLYGLAFDHGYTPASVLPDVARSYATSLGPYRPRNYDRRFHGPVRSREALASSYNVPAVELTSRLGAGALLGVLHDAGFASLTRSPGHYGLGLALGNGDVTLFELANAYRALANRGAWSPATWRAGHRPAATRVTRRVMTAASAALVLDILSDAEARTPGFGISTPFDFPFPVAAKTGTSRHFTDNWAVAVAGNFTVATWVGDFSGRPMAGISGITGAGPLLHRVVMTTATRHPAGSLPTPGETGAVRASVCVLSGERAGPGCPTYSEWFAPGTEPAGVCRWHRPEGLVLPAEYQEWAGQAGPRLASVARVEDSAGEGFRITAPRPGDRYSVPPGVEQRYATLAFRSTGSRRKVTWMVDGVPVPGGRWPLQPGPHTVKAITRNGEADSVQFEVMGVR